MIPKNKKVAVLHPRVFEVWWAVSMMIYLSSILSSQNELVFYTSAFKKDNFRDINFPLKVICPRFKFLSYLIIAYKIRNSDFIFAWNSPMHFVWVLSKLVFRSKAKLYWWNHHYPWYYEKKHSLSVLVKRFLEKFAVFYIDELISNSLYLKTALQDIFPYSSISILYPRLREVFYKTDFALDQKSKTKVFTYSRWVKWKNIDLIFEAFDKLKTRYDFELSIWWIGEELEIALQNRVFDKNIKLLWLLDDVKIIENLKQSSIFLFPSQIDSFGMVALESMFAWVPVVWFDYGWIKEFVRNGENWFLINSRDDFIDKFETLLQDDDLRNTFAKSCLDMTKRDFASDLFEKQLSKILN